jgi:hypothetical protein
MSDAGRFEGEGASLRTVSDASGMTLLQVDGVNDVMFGGDGAKIGV